MSNGAMTELNIGGVLARGAGVLSRNLMSFGSLSVLFMLIPFGFGQFMGVGSAAVGETSVFAIVTLIVLWILLYFLLFATLTHGTICDLRGTPASIRQSLSWGLGLLFPVIGITVIATLGTGLGALLLLVPGLMLMTMWWVAVPAAVVERTGVIESLKRSAELTKGYRWKVFGIIMVIYVGQLALEMVIRLLLTAAPIFSQVAGFLVTVAVTAYFAVVTAVAYHDLRVIKEGVGVQDIARVFD
jgi:hypothetical protein